MSTTGHWTRTRGRADEAWTAEERALGLPELVERWRPRTGRFTPARELDAWGPLDELHLLERRVVDAPDGLRALVRLRESHEDPRVRAAADRLASLGERFGGILTLADMPGFLRHPLIALHAEVEPAATVAMQARDVVADGTERPGFPAQELSWLGGTPSGPTEGGWPRRQDGLPLAFVGQLDLRSLGRLAEPDGERIARLGLAPFGVLQVFWDLETDGTDPDDGPLGAWRVRHVGAPRHRMPVPVDLEDAARQPAALMHGVGTVTLPHPDDVEVGDDDGAERLDFARDHLLRPLRPVGAAATRSGWWRDAGATPIAHWLGHGRSSAEAALEGVLAELPLETGDSWRLLLEAPGTGPLAAWLGEDTRLEIWIRDHDLLRGRFERAWALRREA